jgi:hypothetical protein
MKLNGGVNRVGNYAVCTDRDQRSRMRRRSRAKRLKGNSEGCTRKLEINAFTPLDDILSLFFIAVVGKLDTDLWINWFN